MDQFEIIHSTVALRLLRYVESKPVPFARSAPLLDLNMASICFRWRSPPASARVRIPLLLNLEVEEQSSRGNQHFRNLHL